MLPHPKPVVQCDGGDALTSVVLENLGQITDGSPLYYLWYLEIFADSLMLCSLAISCYGLFPFNCETVEEHSTTCGFLTCIAV